jgi:hypothetical protein
MLNDHAEVGQFLSSPDPRFCAECLVKVEEVTKKDDGRLGSAKS